VVIDSAKARSAQGKPNPTCCKSFRQPSVSIPTLSYAPSPRHRDLPFVCHHTRYYKYYHTPNTPSLPQAFQTRNADCRFNHCLTASAPLQKNWTSAVRSHGYWLLGCCTSYRRALPPFSAATCSGMESPERMPIACVHCAKAKAKCDKKVSRAPKVTNHGRSG
jgi:hypothetical protein